MDVAGNTNGVTSPGSTASSSTSSENERERERERERGRERERERKERERERERERAVLSAGFHRALARFHVFPTATRLFLRRRSVSHRKGQTDRKE